MKTPDEYVFSESAADLMGYQIAFPGIGIAFTDSDIFRILEFPDTVILQSPERIFGVVAFSGRPEINEELLQLFVISVYGINLSLFDRLMPRHREGAKVYGVRAGSPASRQ